MYRKRVRTVLLAACLVVMLAAILPGCAKDASDGDGSEALSMQLAFINEEYVLSGTGEPFTDVPVELEQGSELTYAAVLSALATPTEDGLISMLSPDYKINSAKAPADGGELTIDFSSEGLNGSSMQEYLLISQLVRSFCLTFDNIYSVQFTVDGSVSETLMGHMDATRPYMLQIYVDENGQSVYDVQTVPLDGV